VDVQALIDWLLRHQALLTWLGGGVATAAAGIWAVAKVLLDRRGSRPSAPQASASPPASAPPSVSARSGLAAHGNLHVGGSVIITQSRVPRGAIALAALGLALLGLAIFSSGDRVEVRNGVAVGGAVTGSTITVGPGAAPR
jgi:hypothetical protein